MFKSSKIAAAKAQSQPQKRPLSGSSRLTELMQKMPRGKGMSSPIEGGLKGDLKFPPSTRNFKPNMPMVPRKIPPVMPTPVNPGLVPKNDPFFKSKEFKDFEAKGGPATMDMYNSPYFGSIGSGSVGRAKDEAYRKFKNIPDPTPPRQMMPPAGGVGTTGFKSGFGGLDSGMLRGGPAGGLGAGFGGGLGAALGAANPMAKTPTTTALGAAKKIGSLGGSVARSMMKKGGEVKAVSAPKASSASKKADGVAIKGKTKGRFV